MTESQRALETMVRQTQATARVPALSVALRRNDRELWTCQVGTSGTGIELSADSRFRIGSITKTFTAVLVMQCRDAGLLRLDDPVSRYLDVPAHGELTIRRLLSHTAGLQREPFGDVWDTLVAPDLEGLLKELARAEAVHPQARRFHYSNLGFAVLGQLAAKVLDGQWWPLVQERICGPLGLAATTLAPPSQAVTGYLVDAYSDNARPEPPADFGAVAPAAQLWSTAADMATWGAFLADPESVESSGEVLSAATLAEMRWPLTPRHEGVWLTSFGLGPMLYPQPDRSVHVGHNGAMPGFLAAAYGRQGGPGNPGGVGAAVLASSGTASEIFDLAHRLINEALTGDPMSIPVWLPGTPVPAELSSALGRWWGEGYEYVFRWSEGSLTATGVDDPQWLTPATFAPVAGETDIYRTMSGREAGELLRLTRGPDGEITVMHWATYRFTRRQQTFDGVNVFVGG
ncbi:serine hydrolase [Rhizocola hellebori]|uniref:Serine hydrolase n=1 Tax=Rhizocola hellebori TaxID=1392758 RepID=A0A8J3Q4L4_9ACTN|nr:serine hydrolase domain-containing protein [Rhizocola hellebori]GIH03140.1 serine hydrolase [Rhizocola hellebori]